MTTENVRIGNNRRKRLSIDRTQVLVIFILIASSIILLLGIEKQLKERKKQYICEGHLRHWRSAFEMYQKEKTFAKKNFPWDEKEEWIDNLIQNFFSEKQASFCPASLTQEQKSYRINPYLLANLWDRKSFVLSNEKIAFVFDGQYSSNHFISCEKPLQELDYRHLGGANVLWSDGSISHVKSDTEKVWKERSLDK